MTRRRARQKREPFTNGAPDVLELFGRLLVGGSYRVPVEGTGSQGCKDNPRCTCSRCIAGAAGYMRLRLGRDVAMAVATRASTTSVARIAGKSYVRCSRALRLMNPPKPLDLRQPADRWKLRMIVYDVLTEMVWPERRRALAAMAKDTKMRTAQYIRAHHLVMAELQEAMNDARREFAHRLWGEGDAR